jgi:hypothetical protein
MFASAATYRLRRKDSRGTFAKVRDITAETFGVIAIRHTRIAATETDRERLIDLSLRTDRRSNRVNVDAT